MGEEGELRSEIERPSGASRGAPVRAAAGDFDGDGALDLAVAFTTGEVFAFFTDLPEAQGVWIRLPQGRTGPAGRPPSWQPRGRLGIADCGSRISIANPKSEIRNPKSPASGVGPPRALEAKDGSEVVLPQD